MKIKIVIDKEKVGKIKEKLKLFLSKVLCRTRKLFSEKAFSKGQMILFCGIIVFGSFIYQDLFRYIVFLVVTLIGWLSGHIGLKHVKAVLEKAERAINNPLVPITKQYTEAVQAIHTSCDYLGRVMNKINLEQGTAPYLKGLRELGKEKKGGE